MATAYKRRWRSYMKNLIGITCLMIMFAMGCAHRPVVREVISTPNAPRAIGPYSQAIRAGDTLYCAGQIGLDPKTGKLAGDGFEAQGRQALDNLKAVVTAAGFQLENVVQCQVFITDINNYPAFNKIYSEYFSNDSPARAVVEVSAIPANGLVEVMAVAVRPRPGD
jgi:2-iminobutanoate/2-iminopropanoate deaminase